MAMDSDGLSLRSLVNAIRGYGRGADSGELARGAASGVVSPLLGMPVDTLLGAGNLARAGYGTAGRVLGFLSPDEMPTTLDPEEVPGSSDWIGKKVFGVESPQAKAAQLAMALVTPTPGGKGKAVAEAVGDASKATKSATKAVPAGEMTLEQAIDKLKAASAEAPAVQVREPRMRGQTVYTGKRAVIPEIYDDPRKQVARAAEMVAPESPYLKQMFGVTRQELDEMQLQRMDPALASEHVYLPKKVPEHVEAVTTPRNAQRLVDTIALAMEEPKLAGMPGWYLTDAMMKRPYELLGDAGGAKFFRDFHLHTAPMSAVSTVPKEIEKGSYAHMLTRQGNPQQFYNKKLLPEGLGGPAHSTAHAAGMRNIEASGGERFWKDVNPSQKTPVYFDTRIGRNDFWPTSDAHFVRGTGLPDSRRWVLDPKNRKDPDRQLIPDTRSIGRTEMAPIGEWFNKKVADPLGLTGGVAQPIQWGAMAGSTGVKSEIGAPFLELLAIQIAKSAKRQGISMDEAWDNYILAKGDPRKAYLGFATPEMLGATALAGGGALAAQKLLPYADDQQGGPGE